MAMVWRLLPSSIFSKKYFSYVYLMRSGVRSDMRAANQLHGRGPTDLHLHLNKKKSDYDMMIVISMGQL